MRTLTIEPFGEPIRRCLEQPLYEKSILRLKGRWLQKAGFAPGSKVGVRAVSTGVLEIRIQAERQRSREEIDLYNAAVAALNRANAQTEPPRPALADWEAQGMLCPLRMNRS